MNKKTASEAAQTGVVSHNEMFFATDHPGRGFQKEASRHFLDARPPIPFREENTLFPTPCIFLLLTSLTTRSGSGNPRRVRFANDGAVPDPLPAFCEAAP